MKSPENQARLASDFRAFYHIGVFDVPHKVSTTEALLLVKQLEHRSDSLYGSSIMGYSYPISTEGLLLMNLYDLQVRMNTQSKDFRDTMLHPRPYKTVNPSNDSDKQVKGDVVSWDEMSRIMAGRLGSPLSKKNEKSKEET